jgi:POT family proton-dependent oligopeptide transporter
MEKTVPPAAPDTSGIFGQPRGLTNLFFTELWERFGYYGMRALLTLFMVAPLARGGLEFSNKTAGTIYGTYTMSVYMLSIPGGFIADNFLGARTAVFWGGLIIAAGYFSLAVHSSLAFYTGLVLVACGTGLLKPNISSMVGSLYSRQDPRRDAGFSIFYMGINVGAFLAPLITGWLAQSDAFKGILARNGFDPNHSWHWAFATSGVGMVIGLVIYVLQKHRLANVGHAPAPGVKRPWGTLFGVLGTSAVVFALVRLSDTNPHFAWISYGYVVLPVLAIIWFGTRADLTLKRFAAVFVFSLAYLIFCAVFEQAGSTISLFADQLTRTEMFGYHFPSAWFQSVNSIFVIMLSPLFAWLWIRLGDRAPSSPLKFAAGLFFLALSFLMMIPAAQLSATGKVSPLWLVGLFFLQTVGELCLSPVGLSTLTKLAPANLVGLVMGVWFLAAALGNKLAGTLAGDFTATNAPALADFFMKQALWVGVAFVGLIAIARWVKRLMGEVH